MTTEEKLRALRDEGTTEINCVTLSGTWKNPKTGKWESERPYFKIWFNSRLVAYEPTMRKAVNRAYKNVIEK